MAETHVWYYFKAGRLIEREEGPLTEPQLMELARSGQLNLKTKLRSPTRTNNTEVLAESFPKLASLITQATLEAEAKVKADARAKVEANAKADSERQKSEKAASSSAIVPVIANSPSEDLSAQTRASGLPLIPSNAVPAAIRSKLQPAENVRHFGYIDSKGGCANPSTSKQWLLITDKRILFEASVMQGAGGSGPFVHQSGSIPMAKVSYVGTSTSERQEGCAEGCASVSVTQLTINSSGGHIILAIPTKAEAERAQGVIDGIISAT